MKKGTDGYLVIDLTEIETLSFDYTSRTGAVFAFEGVKNRVYIFRSSS